MNVGVECSRHHFQNKTVAVFTVKKLNLFSFLKQI